MAGRRVLAHRSLDAKTPLAGRLAKAEARRRAPGRGLHRAAKAQLVEIGQFERPRAQAGAVGAPPSAGLRDMAERIGALIAIGGRIRRAAAADGIEHDQDRATHSLAHWLTIQLATGSMSKAAANKAFV